MFNNGAEVWRYANQKPKLMFGLEPQLGLCFLPCLFFPKTLVLISCLIAMVFIVFVNVKYKISTSMAFRLINTKLIGGKVRSRQWW